MKPILRFLKKSDSRVYETHSRILAAAAVFLGLCPVTGWSAPASPAPILIPTAGVGETTASDRENIPVTTLEVEVGQFLLVPAPQPTFHLLKAPQFVQVLETRPDGLRLRGEKIGETLLLVWSAEGVRSYRIKVLRSSAVMKIIERTNQESSPLYRARRDRSFRVSYDSVYSLLEEDRTVPNVTESRKFYNHHVKFWGKTPVGESRTEIFYEYRKERALQKSVSIPRDFTTGIYESQLPFFKGYDFVGGTQYITMSRFGFPGHRIRGFSLQPSLSRWSQPHRGQTDLNWFVGEKRDGSVIDNPAGIQNRLIRGNMSGERLDHYLWKDGKISFGAYHQWAGPRTEAQAKHNFDGRFRFRFPYVEVDGESGIDNESAGAGEVRAAFKNRFSGLDGRFYNVNKHYRTVPGGVQDRGNRGFEAGANLSPFLIFGKSDAVVLRARASWYRNHFSQNPDPHVREDYIKWQRGDLTLRLPYRFSSSTAVYFLDQRPSAFPFTQRRVSEELSRDFILHRYFLSRLRLFFLSAVESFRDAEESPGFNSTRYEFGGGANLNLRGGFWLQSRYAWNRLKEEDLPTLPTRLTHPDQLIVAGGWTRTFRKIPIGMNLDVRYVEEGETHGKIHQPYLNEDRLEAHVGMSLNIRQTNQLFMDSRIVTTQSTVAAPDRSELSLIIGMRTLLDTKLSFPQHGVVEGYVFQDRNGDGVRGSDEPGIAGHEVYVEDGKKTVTNESGYYRLKVGEGWIKVVAVPRVPEGYFYTTVNWKKMEIAGKSRTSLDFGLAAQSRIQGRTYADTNRNGMFDAADQTIPGVRITLASGQSVISSTDGFYAFLRIPPGPNTIRVALDTVPVGYKTKTQIERTFDAAPADLMHFDVVFSAVRSISGFVFEDLNQNGAMDPDETGIAGVMLRAGDARALTGKNGRYQLGGLKPGKTEIVLDPKSLPPDYHLLTIPITFDLPTGPFTRRDVNFALRKSYGTEE